MRAAIGRRAIITDSTYSQVCRRRFRHRPPPPPAVQRAPSLRSHASAPQPRAAPPPPPIRKGYLVLGGLAIYAFTTYGVYLYRSYRVSVAQSATLDVPEDVSGRYDDTAATFDRDVDLTEWLMGMRRLRRKLVRKAHGRVLEVAAGTGRNLRFYPLDKLEGLVLVDKSRPMLERARDGFVALRMSGVFPRDSYKKVEFLVQDAMKPILLLSPQSSTTTTTISSSSAGFDTVVQTMGLCSTSDPVRLLRHLGSLTDPEHGQILLLEHGRSHYAWLNDILDSLAKTHAMKHGCWWNRDIKKIVEESGLEVVTLKRYHFGTTWWIELRPSRKR